MNTGTSKLILFLSFLFLSQITFAQARIIKPSRNTTSSATRVNPVQSFATVANNQAWVARHNLTGSQYQSDYSTFNKQGYRLTHISGYEVGGQARYAAIWEKKSGPAMATHHGMTSTVYQQKFTAYSQQGYRLTHISAFDVRGKDYYNAIWEKKSGPAMAARHKMSAAKYQQEYNSWKSKGYRLVKVSGYAINGTPHYAAIWEKKSGPALATHHGMTAAVYQQKFTTYAQQGFKLSYLSAYTVKGKDYYAAIWEKTAGPASSARHGLSAANYQNEFDNHIYTGYRPRLVSGYNINGKAHYAAIWDAGALKTSDLSKINSKIQGFMNKYNVPGLQIAVAKDEKLVFARGYGKADQENNVLMGPNLKGRIASISKPITSAAIHKLDISDNSFDLNSRVFGVASIFGTSYNTKNLSLNEKQIKVVNLLEHTAGANVWDNNTDLDHSNSDPKAKEPNPTSDPMFQNSNFSHAQLFTWVLDNRNPDYAPGSYYAYSNFGYSLLGRIIEKKTNQSYETWVRNNILKPAGAGGMYISKNSKAQKRANEMVYYGSNPYGANIERMDSHGGWAGSVIDLLRFMSRVDGRPGKKDILPIAAINSMKSRTSYVDSPVYTRSYGKGWGLKAGDGVNHSGALNGSYSILEFRQDGTSFAIIVNSRSGADDFASDFNKLGGEVMNLISQWPTHDLF
jgi:CubicO group peptidase (beta-lactamase class C family)